METCYEVFVCSWVHISDDDRNCSMVEKLSMEESEFLAVSHLGLEPGMPAVVIQKFHSQSFLFRMHVSTSYDRPLRSHLRFSSQCDRLVGSLISRIVDREYWCN